MKILFINPPVTSKERYGQDIGDIGGHQAPLGLCCLAAFLEKHGFKVSLIDAEAEQLNHQQIIERINIVRPHVIGLTSTTVAFAKACDLAKDIKSQFFSTPLIIGGPHVSANPKKTLLNEWFDYGVMQEGEMTTLEMLKTLARGGSMEKIQGIVYRNGDEIRCNEPRPYINDLDSLPFPARHLLPDINRYRPPLGSYLETPVISMITSRGCPYECIFCDNNVFGRKTRYHSPAHVVAEVEEVIRRFGAREIAFLDDTFTADQNRIREILSLIQKRRIRIKWSCMTRADTLTKDLAKEMRSAGCWQVSMGVESGNQDILDFTKKKITLAQIRAAAGWCAATGMYLKGFFMVGHPMDSVATINETIGFAKSLPLDDIVVSIATPVPGTQLAVLAPDYGMLQSDNWSDFSYWKPVFIPQGLSESILYLKQLQFYAQFYLRGRVILRQVGKIQNASQLIKYAANVLKSAVFFIFKIMSARKMSRASTSTELFTKPLPYAPTR